MTDADQIYYRRRELQERALAARADDAVSRDVHLQLADRYALLLAPTELNAAA